MEKFIVLAGLLIPLCFTSSFAAETVNAKAENIFNKPLVLIPDTRVIRFAMTIPSKTTSSINKVIDYNVSSVIPDLILPLIVLSGEEFCGVTPYETIDFNDHRTYTLTVTSCAPFHYKWSKT